MSFSVEFHHMGSFVNDPTPYYEGGQVHVVHNLDMDKWSYSQALGIVKEKFGYFGDIKMWWKTRESGFESGLTLVTMDSHALELAKYALTNKCEVEVYIEHDVSLPCYAEEERVLSCNERNVSGGESKGENVCGEVKNEDEVVEMGDNGVEDVHFGDSVEEKVVALDLGSRNPSQESAEYGEKCEKRKRKYVPRKRPIESRRELPMRKAKKGRTGGVDGGCGKRGNNGEIQELKEENNTEEFDNGESYSKGDVGATTIVNYTRFKKEDMSKDFEFKHGMEFGSLQEFKEAIIEHSILNGREIRFLKNDADRVRVKCKHCCNFEALVRKVGSDHTFRMKTLDPKHTCERVFNNKNAKSKWVAKVMADKFRSSDKMKINDIITEVKSLYAIGITASTARKARQIAKGMCTTESQKPHPQGGQATVDPKKASLKQKKTIAKEQPGTNQKRGKRKAIATCTRKTEKSHGITMSQQEGPIDAEPIVHTADTLIVEPPSTHQLDESNGGEQGTLEEDKDSGDSYLDGDNGATIMNYTRFNKEDMSKDFEFKHGMEFGSLQEFKEAIIEHSILNGREIRYQKNDAIRVRVRCKHNSCNFVAFVSKVGSDNTFRMKTLDPKHTCERVFNNKNAKSKWVAKVVADKVRSSDKMKIIDIITEIEASYAIGITPSRARRARQIAKGMCNAESQKPGQLTADLVKASLKQKKDTAKEPIMHTADALIVEPLSTYIPGESDGGLQGIVEGGGPFGTID